ncbi:hypothetical protein Btru_041668 [Bulinus truncatus]|nr:hypothetical protein Btru_041668 [Bulinus truncatus]
MISPPSPGKGRIRKYKDFPLKRINNNYMKFNGRFDFYFISEDSLVLGKKDMECTNPLKELTIEQNELLSSLENKSKQLTDPSNPRKPSITDGKLKEHFKEVMSFRGNTYLLTRYPASHIFGNFLCSVYGGYLVEINDEEELQAMKKFAVKHAVPRVHIGMNDARKQGEWIYSYSGLPAYTKWGSSEPDLLEDERCVYIPAEREYLMADLGCEVEVHLVCEIPGGQ